MIRRFERSSLEDMSDRAQKIVTDLEICEDAIALKCNLNDDGVKMLSNMLSNYFKPMRVASVYNNLLQEMNSMNIKLRDIPSALSLIKQIRKNYDKAKDFAEVSVAANNQVIDVFKSLITSHQIAQNSYIGEYYGALICFRNVVETHCDRTTASNLHKFLDRYLQALSDASVRCSYDTFSPPQEHEAYPDLERMEAYTAEMRLNVVTLEYELRNVLDINSEFLQNLYSDMQSTFFDRSY
jgi:hypothetical protein